MPSMSQLARELKKYLVSKQGNNTIGGNLYVDTASIYDIGSASKPFDTVYADNLVGTPAAPDELVKITAADTAADYLLTKLQGDSYISVSSTDKGGGDLAVAFSFADTSFLKADGTVPLTGNLSVNSGITIDGVDISVLGTRSVIDGNGLLSDDVQFITGSPTLTLGTPSTLSESSTDAVTSSSHTHAIITTSDGFSYGDRILATAADKSITLAYLRTPRISSLAGAENDLLLDPVDDLRFLPGGQITLTEDVYISTDGADTGFGGQGWQIIEFGGLAGKSHLDIRSIYAEELHTTAFIADTARIQVGETFVANSMGMIASKVDTDGTNGFTVPAVSSSATIWIENVPDLPGQVFNTSTGGDYVLLRFINRNEVTEDWATATSYNRGYRVLDTATPYGCILDHTSGTDSRPGTGVDWEIYWRQLSSVNSLTIANVWGQVTNYNEQASYENAHTYTFTTRYGQVGMYANSGSLVIGFGQPGASFIHASAIDATAPWTKYKTWSGNPWTPDNINLHTSVGNLSGISDATFGGSLSGYGLYATNVYLKGALNAGDTMIDTSGIVFTTATGSSAPANDIIHWARDTDNEDYGTLAGFHNTSTASHQIQLAAQSVSGNDSSVSIFAGATATEGATLYLWTAQASLGNNTPFITMRQTVANPSQIWMGADEIFFDLQSGAEMVFSGDENYRPYVTDIYDWGTPSYRWGNLYVKNIVADTITGGESLGGHTWEYNSGNMYIKSEWASSDRVLYIVNDNATYQMNLDVEGDIIVGGVVDGVDIAALGTWKSAHDNDVDAHHDPVTIGNGLTLSTQLIGIDAYYGIIVDANGISVDAHSGIAVSVDGVAVYLNPSGNGLELTSGLAIQDAVAGDGLAISATKVISVGVGDGLAVTANAIAVDLATTSGLGFSGGDLAVGDGDGIDVLTGTVQVDSTVARSDWAVAAGTGLTDGGNLSASGITINVAAASGIDVQADSVGAKLAAPYSGLNLTSDLAIDDSIAGAGLDITNKVMYVFLATPSGLNTTSGLAIDDSLTGTHMTWETTKVIDVDESANYTWTNGHGFQAQITTRDIIPELTDTYDIGSYTKLYSQSFISQMNALIFAENTIQVIGGLFYIAKQQGTLGAVAPTDVQIDINLTDAEASVDDFLIVRAHDTGGTIKAEYIQLVSFVSGTTWNVTRDLAAAHVTDPAWTDGTPFVLLGNTGDGRIELNSIDTPRISLIEQGSSYNVQTERIRIGDLNGLLNGSYVSETYGIAIGANDVVTTAPSSFKGLTVDDTDGLRLFNTSIDLYNGANKTVEILSVGDVKFGSNVSIPSFQLQASSGDMWFGKQTKGHLWWDQSVERLYLRDGATSTNRGYIDTDGSLVFGGGYTSLDENGLSLTADNVGFQDESSVVWNYSSSKVAELGAYITTATTTANLKLFAGLNGYDGIVRIEAYSATSLGAYASFADGAIVMGTWYNTYPYGLWMQNGTINLSAVTGTTNLGINITSGVIELELDVGIGTNSPDAPLHILNSSPSIKLEATGASSSEYALIDSSVDGSLRYYADIGNDSGLVAFHMWSVGNTELMRLKDNGNLGIGTNSPANKLHLYGTVPAIRLEDSAAGGIYARIHSNSIYGSIWYESGASSSATQIFDINGTERFRVDNAGVDVTGALTVTGSSTLPSINMTGLITIDDIYNVDYQIGAYSGYDGVVIKPSTTNPDAGDALFTVMSSGGTARLRVEHSGQIEVTGNLYTSGTATSNSHSYVNGTLYANTNAYVTNSLYVSDNLEVTDIAGIGVSNSGRSYKLRTYGLSGRGIELGGTATDSPEIAFYQVDTRRGYLIYNNAVGMGLLSNNGDVYTYANSGTTGIQTSTPSTSYTLDVNGSAHATSHPSSSDVRFKKNIATISDAMSKVRQLRGVTFNWNKNYPGKDYSPVMNKRQIGLIAQEVENIVPEAVLMYDRILNDGTILTDARAVVYDRLVAVLIEAIKDLDARVQVLESA